MARRVCSCFPLCFPLLPKSTKPATPEPYLALRLDLDPLKIGELVLKAFPRSLPPVQECSRFFGTAPMKDIARLRQDARLGSDQTSASATA